MKRIRTIQLAVTLMVLLVPTALSAVNTIIHTVNYGSSGMTVGTDTLGGVTYTTVNYGDLFNGGEPGKPSLPIDYLKFSVPYNATNFSVTATLSNSMIGDIDHLVYPCQQPRMMSDTTPVVINLPDSSVYYTSSFYPSQAAWVVDEGFLAGENHIVTVAVMPIAYKHIKGMITSRDQLRRSGTVRLTLHYDLADSLAMYPIVRNDTALRNEGYRLTQSMVVNPTNVDAYAPDIYMDTMMVINPNSGDGLNVDPPHPIDDLIDPNPIEIRDYPYLIITTNDLYHSMRRIVGLKRQKGYDVKIVTVDDIMSDPHASQGDIIKKPNWTYHVAFNDSAGKIRQYLKNAYKYWGTRYVLLAGTDVPYRCANIENSNDSIIPNIPTDLYYSDLNGDWSLLNDSTLNTDSLDFHPELYVGRILAIDPQQMINYYEKLARYELNPGHGDYDYLGRIFYSKCLDQQKEDSWTLYSLHPSYYYSRIFNDSICINESNSSRYPSGKDIIDSLNIYKPAYISIMNHAGPSGYITYGRRHYYEGDNYLYLWAIDTVNIKPNGQLYDDPVNGNGLNNMTNKWYPSVCYSIGCTTIPFDMASGYGNVIMNLGESFTTGKDYGGPAFLGNTREGLFNYRSAHLERLFAPQLLPTKKNYKIGKAEAFSREINRTREPYLSLTHNLIGDPEFEIWTDIPQQFTNISVTRTDNSVTISGITEDSTTVAIYSNNGSVRSVLANTSSITRNVSSNSTVMVYKHNYIPYIAPLLLQNANLTKSQYVIASDVTAGKAVDIDSNRTQGDVTVKSGVEYEIEASGTVTLHDGFKVEKGATFAVYPSCF